MTETILDVQGIDVFYGASHILFDLTFSAQKGRTLALLGRNGAGKSTTMKAIMGVIPVRAGAIRLGGADVGSRAAHKVARMGVGLVPEDRQVFPSHTVEDNLRIAMKPGVDGRSEWHLGNILDAFPLLESLMDRKAGMLSGGEQQLLSMARCLMGNPDVILLDEPSEGLAPIIVQQIGGLIRDLRQTGVTIVLAEQNMHFCLGISDDAVVIDRGRIVYADTIGALRQNDDVLSRYLAV